MKFYGDLDMLGGDINITDNYDIIEFNTYQFPRRIGTYSGVTNDVVDDFLKDGDIVVDIDLKKTCLFNYGIKISIGDNNLRDQIFIGYHPSGNTCVNYGGNTNAPLTNKYVWNTIDYISYLNSSDAAFINEINFWNYDGSATSNGFSGNMIIFSGTCNYPTTSVTSININNGVDITKFGTCTYCGLYSGTTSNGSLNLVVNLGFWWGNGWWWSYIYGTHSEYTNINGIRTFTSFGGLPTWSYNGPAVVSNSELNRTVQYQSWQGGAVVNGMCYKSFTQVSSSWVAFGTLTYSQYWWVRRATLDNGINNRALYCGGIADINYMNLIDYININVLSTCMSFGQLSTKRWGAVGTSNGPLNKGLIIGGSSIHVGGDGTYLNIIDHINIITSGNSSLFGYLAGARNFQATASNA